MEETTSESREEEEFRAFTKRLFEDFMEWYPPLATFFGIHKYDNLMPDGSKAFIEEGIDQLSDYRSKLESFDEDALGDSAVDLRIAKDVMDLQLFDWEEWRLWRTFPSAADDVGEALFPLFARDFAPAEERYQNISERIKGSIAYLEESKDRLEDPIEVYCEVGLESARQLPGFLGVILKKGEKTLPEDEFDALMGRTEQLEEALDEYASWIEDEMKDARRDFPIGRERLQERLKLRGVEPDLDDILALGESYLQSEKQRLEELAESIEPGETVQEVKKQLERDHPDDFESALEEYREQIRRARDFVVKKDFASIPDNEELRVVETPSFLRHIIPFAAYLSPAKFEDEQEGIYMVTPPADESMMERHNYYSISNTSVHEGYPGHHLQLSVANAHPSYVRLLTMGTEFVEGWAHYCEEAVKELGFDDAPEHRFMQTVDLVWRAARVIIDVKLSSGEMSFDEAVDFLMEHTSMERDSAEAEVKRYTMTPGQPLSYLLGKHLIKQLRADREEELGREFDPKEFHDTLLQNGRIPIKYHRQILQEQMTEG